MCLVYLYYTAFEWWYFTNKTATNSLHNSSKITALSNSITSRVLKNNSLKIKY